MLRFIVAVLAAMAAFALCFKFSHHFIASVVAGALALFVAARIGD